MAQNVLLAGCAELAARTRLPIAGFESDAARTFARLMDAGAIHIDQSDVVRHSVRPGRDPGRDLCRAPTVTASRTKQDPLPWRADIVSRSCLAIDEDKLGAWMVEP